MQNMACATLPLPGIRKKGYAFGSRGRQSHIQASPAWGYRSCRAREGKLRAAHAVYEAGASWYAAGDANPIEIWEATAKFGVPSSRRT